MDTWHIIKYFNMIPCFKNITLSIEQILEQFW
uniref:Uncharacterized protein n=1 Tax=Tetranychus urticae TaxID=32264 RepID=T1KX32_TETUR